MNIKDAQNVVEIQTYDDGQGDPLVPVGIVTDTGHGITLNLPAHTDAKQYGPNVYIERRANGFSIIISPGDGEEPKCIVHMLDDGSMNVMDDASNIVIETPAMHAAE
jgi:hypothetical protein